LVSARTAASLTGAPCAAGLLMEELGMMCLAPEGISRCRRARLGGGRAELGAARADRAKPLVEARPGPRLGLPIPSLRLVASGLEVLEPCVRLLDHEQLLRLAFVHHPRLLLGSLTPAMLGPGSDGQVALAGKERPRAGHPGDGRAALEVAH